LCALCWEFVCNNCLDKHWAEDGHVTWSDCSND
jgi:hypothetical protein